MPKRGGSSGITGYDYQCWFIAYQISKLSLYENLTIQAEANLIREPVLDSAGHIIGTTPKINYIDDVIVYTNKIPTVYNIKYLAPQDNIWTINKLISQGVIEDVLKQIKSFPNQKNVFVSQSSCPLFNDIFKSVYSLKSKREVDLTLNKKQKRDWEKFKEYTRLNDKQLIKISRNINYERGYEIERYQELILSHSKDKFNNYEQIPFTLYALAIESCKESKPIKIVDFINWLEKNNIRAISKLKFIDLIKESKKASASLLNWNNIFGSITSSHIRRSDVDKVLNWIDLPTLQDKKPILVLTGKAGCGKSVIMREVLEELDRRKTKCIGLKVDLYDASNYLEFNSKLSLNDDFEKLINSLASNGSLTIIFDQLDSLSMTLSSSRKSLNFYFDLINRIALIPKIKIILSCRSYDLNFDPSLKVLEKEDKIEVSELSKQEINRVLTNINLEYEKLPVKLSRLLSTPHHLNIFCTIYNVNVKLEELKSIQDLYNELWQWKILNNIKAFPNLILLIKEIVEEMSANQKLNVSKIIYQDKYIGDIEFLLSEGILSPANHSIQFFHQTFFEYCFARLFVNDQKDLVKYVISVHQGLFIRSTIKHVLSYLKSVNTKEYLRNIVDLLHSNNVRFHIKFLVLNMLGSDDSPIEEEWDIIKRYVINRKKLIHFFLESITNLYWLNRLNSNGHTIGYLSSQDETLNRSCETMFYKLIETEPIPVLRFLLDSGDFKNKKALSGNLLFYLKDWNNQESIQVLDAMKETYHDNYTFHLDTILGKAFKYHREWVAQFLKQYLDRRIDHYCTSDKAYSNNLYGHELEESLKKLYETDAELLLDTVLPLIKKLIHCSKFNWGSEYFADSAFYGHERHDTIYPHWKLLNHIIDFSEKLATNEHKQFTEIILPLKEESSLTLINILLSGLLSNYSNYVDVIFELLTKPNFLKEYNYEGTVTYKVHKLINSFYELLSPIQINELNQAILLSEDEKIKKGDRREWKGSHIYSLLNAIPASERKKNTVLQKKYLELQRKFGVREMSKPEKTEVSWVGPPLPQNAYEKMTLENWLNSFKEYNESTGWDNNFHNKRGFHFGGLIEHSRTFGSAVKANPEKFFPFLEKILTEDIASDYISEGLVGLIEANYDAQKVSSLIKKVNSSENGKKIRRAIIRAIEYVDRNCSLDNELFEIIKDFAVNDPDPTKEIWQVNADRNVPYYGGDPLTAGINSVRGSAVFSLVALRNSNIFFSEIFDILEKVSEDNSLSVRCSAVANLYALIRFDEERTFKIFQLFAKDKNPHILRNSLNCISYYSKRQFALVKDLIIATSKIEGDYGYKKVKNFVGQIIMYLYTEGVKGSNQLFELLFKSSSEIRAGALNFAINILNSKNTSMRSKSRKVFLGLLTSQSQSINNEYSYSFKEFTPEIFPELYSLLLEYCKNRNTQRRESYNLYKYLLECMNLYPKECVNLVELLIHNFKINQGEFFATEDPIKLLIGSYNRLKEYRLKNNYVEKAMDVFDKLIQIPAFRYTTNRVLSEADYG